MLNLGAFSNEVVGVHSRERDKSFLEFYLDRSSKQQSAKSSAGSNAVLPWWWKQNYYGHGSTMV